MLLIVKIGKKIISTRNPLEIEIRTFPLGKQQKRSVTS